MNAKTVFDPAVLRVLALLWLVPAVVLGEEGISKRTRDLFEWYDRLGFEDVSRMSFVEVHTGQMLAVREAKMRTEWREGFLVSGNPEVFTVLGLDLATSTYRAKEDGLTTPYKYRVAPFEKHVRDVLRQMRDPLYFVKWDEDNHFGRSEQLYRCGQIFVMARECERRGMGALAEQLVEALARAPVHGPGITFSTGLRAQIATVVAFRVWAALHDESKSWKEIAGGFRLLVEHCPESENVGPAKEMLAKLERLVAEDAEHAKAAPKSLEGLPAPEKARELVWRLRNVVGITDVVPGFQPPVVTGGPVMDALRGMGMEAVPALVAELRDAERVSRFANEPMSSHSMSYTPTQEMAVNLLNEIAGFSFDTFVNGNRPDARWLQMAQFAEGWWKACQSGKEQGWLAEVVRKGGGSAAECGERLHDKYPEGFVEAALQGVAAAAGENNLETRLALLRLLGLYREPRVEAAMVAHLANVQSSERVTTARLLKVWKRPEGDEAMRADWEKTVARGLAPTGKFKGGGSSMLMGQLVEFLAHFAGGIPPRYVAPEAYDDCLTLQYLVESDLPENLRAVLQSWPKLPIEYRQFLVEVVIRFAESASFRSEILGSPTHRAFCQELLLAALEDVTELPEGRMACADGFIPCPRLCDVAGDGLHKRWPTKYDFDLYLPRAKREHQRVRILNAERKELGQQELPLPPERARVPADRQNYVVAVEWDGASAPPNDALAAQIAAWKDHPLQVDAIVTALSAYAKKPQDGTVGLRVSALREGEFMGVVVRARLVRGESRKSGAWRAQQLVFINRQLGAEVNMSGNFEVVFGQKWSGFREKAVEALKMSSPVGVAIMAEAAQAD